jgi:hypothetical protein
MKVLIVLFVLYPGIIFSQTQERKVAAYNIGFGAFSAGVGSVLNKKSKENWHQAFVRGLWQGSIGGLLNYTAKKSTYLISKYNNVSYAVPSRLLSAAGNSIIQNAAANEPFLKNWSFEYCFLRLDFSANAVHKFKVRLLPVSIIATAIILPQGKLDISSTLLTGTMVCQSDEPINTIRGKHNGVNYGRAFIYDSDTLKYHIIAHEIVHEYQYREYLVFNTYFKQGVTKLDAPFLKKLFTNYIYPDVPYFGLFYMLEGMQPGAHKYKNYFEFEAERFASNKYVPVN